MRTYRLTNEPGGLGLSCTAAGLSLAGTPLLRRSDKGFAPRPAAEIGSLMKAAFGDGGDAARLESSLEAIARALNGGELARAAIAAVLTRTPELSSAAALRLAAANDNLAKYNADELRDWHGRWTRDDAAGPPPSDPPRDARPERQVADAADARAAAAAPTVRSDADQEASPAPETSGTGEERDQMAPALRQAFEREYDDLGPVEFAKAVIQFGDRLGREGANLAPDEKDRALAEYAFLEDRLSFWLAYEYTPPTARGNLLSAAQFLFQGAMVSGIAHPGYLPKSMLDVAADVWANDSPPLRPRFPADPAVEVTPKAPAEPEARPIALAAPLAPPVEVEGLGGTVPNSKVGIVWNGGRKDQGIPYEGYVKKQLPDVVALAATAKTFDQFAPGTGTAVSVKTLNTLSVTYIKDPRQIYYRITKYVNDAENYRPRAIIDADPDLIESKMIQLAIPEYTSPTQWRYLFWALQYGREHGVSILITRIRE